MRTVGIQRMVVLEDERSWRVGIDSQEFSQVVKSSRVEAIITERRESVLYV